MIYRVVRMSIHILHNLVILTFLRERRGQEHGGKLKSGKCKRKKRVKDRKKVAGTTI